jgi:Domain of unknown function (DU1801)
MFRIYLNFSALKTRCAMNELEHFYTKHGESINECFLAMKQIILARDPEITNEWKYNMPFFCYRGKMFCYLWIHSKLQQPFLGMVEGKHLIHPELQYENRSRIKIMLLDPDKDLPIKTIHLILDKALNLYISGIIKIRRR